MRTAPRLASLALFAAVLIFAPAASGQDSQDGKELAELLARPVSPGTLVMLMPHVKDQRVPDHWRRALWNADPRVRRIAARLLYAARATQVASSFKQVLETETDQEAALELARGLLSLDAGDANAAILAAAGRLSPGPFAMAIAQARGRATLALLDRLNALRMPLADRIAVTRLIAGGSASDLQGVAHVALESGNTELWLSALSVSQDDSLDLGPVFEAALGSTTPAIRDYTWWHAAVMMALHRPVPAVARTPAASTPTDVSDPLMPFGQEMAARVLNRAPVEDAKVLAWFRERPSNSKLPDLVGHALRGPLFQFLTPAEQDALYYGRPEGQRPTGKTSPPPRLKSKGYGDYRTMRTVSNLPNGLALDLVRQMGCKLGDDSAVGGAVVRYDETRTLRAIEYFKTTLDKPCEMTARYLTLIAATPAQPEMIPEKREILLLPMHKAFLACLDGPAQREPSSLMETTTSAVPLGPSGITPPKKTRMVNPIYPKDAQMQLRQGSVIIEATITPEGCVSRGEVLQTVAPDLDISAMRAVTAWQFTPTLLDGVAVPVIMTVTVQFQLR
jgi:TonB family protein